MTTDITKLPPDELFPATTQQLPKLLHALSEVQEKAQLARKIEITDQESYETACARLQDVKRAGDGLEKMRKDLKRPYLDAGRKIDHVFSPATTALEEASASLTSKTMAYRRAIEQERAARAAEARRVEAAARAKLAEQQAEAQARQAAMKQPPAQAELPEEEVPVAKIVVLPQAATAEGISVRKTKRAVVHDIHALVRAAADGDTDAMSLLVVHEPSLLRLARDRQFQLDIPGVSIVETEHMAVRR